MQPTEERWLPALGHEGRFEVSDQGRVRSVPRLANGPKGRRQVVAGTIYKEQTHPDGYLRVQISYPDGRRRTVNLNVLVLEAFAGPRPEPGMQARHLDGNKRNNTRLNLAWGTVSENTYDQVRHGTHVAASRTHCKRGHLLAGDNLLDTGYLGRVYRRCRECTRMHAREYQRKQREKRAALRSAA